MSAPPPAPDIPIEGKTLKTLIQNHLKRTHHMFSTGVINEADEEIVLRESYASLSFFVPDNAQIVPTGQCSETACIDLSDGGCAAAGTKLKWPFSSATSTNILRKVRTDGEWMAQ